MKKTIVISFFFSLLLGAWAHAEVTLSIVQPYENSNLPAVKRSFVFGAVTPATAAVTINGIPVKPNANGGYYAMIPFSPGQFKIEAIASDGVTIATVTRTVNVDVAPSTYPADYARIDPLTPKIKMLVAPRDEIDVSFQGAPGGTATFKFTGPGRSKKFPMIETSTGVSGVYKGSYRAQIGDHFLNEDVEFFLKRKDGRVITGKAGATITSINVDTPRVLEIKDDAILLTGPNADFGYASFLPPGVRMEITGEQGDYTRVRLGGTETGWVKTVYTTLLPDGTPAPRSISHNIRIRVQDNSSIIEIPLQNRHPFRLDQEIHPHALKLTLYGVTADTDRIRYKSEGSVVKEIFWRQASPDVLVFDIATTQQEAWGYDARYEGNNLVLEIRHKPQLKTPFSLSGLKVVIDAGHSTQSFGTSGPHGTTEAATVLSVANVVKSELEKKGAQVVLTQDGTRDPTLQDRVNLAWRERAQLFISLHLDACEVGQDARDIEGYSVHYYLPQSHTFAELIHQIYGKKTEFHDQGLWRSNLAVCRATQMPSILLEQGFLMLPEYEEILISPKHQKTVAEVLISAITKYLKESN